MKALESFEVLAIDTEFQREKTYYPILALLQISDGEECFLFDSISLNLEPLFNYLHTSNQIKLFHSASQDLEILYEELDSPIPEVYDTQLAAQLLGYPSQISLKNLVSDSLGENLLKEETVSDWTRRPLSDSQIVYAVEDVIYLPKLFNNLLPALKRKDKYDWYAEECKEMNQAKDPIEKLLEKNTGPFDSPFYKAMMKDLIQWREKLAKRKNLPRNWILKDHQIKKVIHSRFGEDLLNNKILSPKQYEHYMPEFRLFAKTHAQLSQKKFSPSNRQKNEIDNLYNKFKSCIADISQKYNVPAELIINHRRLKKLAQSSIISGQVTDLNGWRGTLLNKRFKKCAAKFS